MGSMEDDFGDLYADLDDQVNAGIAAVQESHSAEEFDSLSEEYGADEQVGEAGEGPMSCVAAGDLLLEAEDSDSEDDLHIVLNEENCSNLPTSERGSDEIGLEWCEEEDEDEDLVIVTCSNHHQHNDKKRVEQFSSVDGLVHGRAERASAANICCTGWCVGSQIAGFPNKSVTSMSGRGDWNQLTPSCSRVSMSCNSCISLAAQTGHHFSLPKKRTIFDINIEAFEQKPWRQQGVDITYYFNFDLNEESWKSYCQSLDQFRQQGKMSARFSVNESSWLTQVLKFEQMSSKVNASEPAQCVNGERVSFTMDNVDKGLRRLEMRKGRAIQVEHGIGERMPSTDIRRPRHRDSDVIIQVTMEDAVEDRPAEELGHSKKQDVDCSGSKYDNWLHEGMLRVEQDGQVCSAILPSPEVSEANYRGTAEAVVANLYYKNDDKENPSSADASILKAASPFAIQANNNLSTSGSDSHSEASKDSDCSKKIHNFVKMESVSSVTKLRESKNYDCYYSNGSRSNSTKSKEKDWKCHSDGLSLSENYRDRIRTRLDSMVELITPAIGKEVSVLSYGTSQNDNDTFGVGCRIREWKPDQSLDVGEHLSFDDETKRPRSYKSRRHAEKHMGGKAPAKVSHRKGNYDISHKRNLVERGSRPKRVASEHNGTNSEYFHLYEREMRSDSYEDSDESILKSDSFFLEKYPYLGHREGKVDQHHISIKDGRAENAIRNSYREQNLLVMERRHTAYFNREGENSSHKSDRYAPGNARLLRNSKTRYRNDTGSCNNMNISDCYIEHDATNLRYLDRKLPDSITHAAQVADGRGLLGASSPRDILALSLKSSEQFVGQKQSLAVRERQFRNKKNGNHFPSSNYHSHSSDKNDLELYPNEYNMDERDLYSDENMEFTGYSALIRPQLHVDEEVWLRHREQVALSMDEGSFFCMKNSRNKKSHVKHHDVVGYSYSEDHVLVNGRKKIIPEESAAYESREDSIFVLDNFDKRRHELETLEHREAVNLHLNDVKRKFLRRGNLDATSERQSNTEHQGDKKSKSSRRKRCVCRQEVAYRLSKLEGRHQNPVSLEVKDFESENPDDNALKKCQDKKPIPQVLEDDEIEEGQLIEEPDDQVVGLLKKNQIPKKKNEYSAIKPCLLPHLEEKNIQSIESTSNSDTFGQFNNKRILETLAKMEKRRERFKEPIAPKQVEKSLKLQVDVSALTDEVKPQRPARKRRWGVSRNINIHGP